ncbi:MAG: hypothetical protein LBD24_05650 [Spirochaetaceae bacterium]|jgi:uncharacterized protein YutE (UPF0331/DUF86 family)|nr:hypothetical protein [Spirochaetaceae bacterium]
MEDIEDYHIFGIPIGGGKVENRQENNDYHHYLMGGLLGGMVLGFNMAQLLDGNSEYQRKIQRIFVDYEKEKDIKTRLRNIRQNIESANEVAVYGGILLLFSELERVVGLLHTKYISRLNTPLSFTEKVLGLENRCVISSVEAGVLREIYKKRNVISHGKYQQVDKRDVLACYELASQFINKYYALT